MSNNTNKTIKQFKRSKYRLTYPMYGNKIYESKSFDKAVKKCYHEFKQLSDVHEGMFVITNLNTKTEYTFQVNSKKLTNLIGAGQKNNIISDKSVSCIEQSVNVNDNMTEKIRLLENKIKMLENKIDIMENINITGGHNNMTSGHTNITSGHTNMTGGHTNIQENDLLIPENSDSVPEKVSEIVKDKVYVKENHIEEKHDIDNSYCIIQ